MMRHNKPLPPQRLMRRCGRARRSDHPYGSRGGSQASLLCLSERSRLLARAFILPVALDTSLYGRPSERSRNCCDITSRTFSSESVSGSHPSFSWPPCHGTTQSRSRRSQSPLPSLHTALKMYRQLDTLEPAWRIACTDVRGERSVLAHELVSAPAAWRSRTHRGDLTLSPKQSVVASSTPSTANSYIESAGLSTSVVLQVVRSASIQSTSRPPALRS